MNIQSLVLAAGVCVGMAGIDRAGGDPFYFSTWYGQSNPGAGGPAASSMPDHPYQATYSFSGPLYPSSPRYFHPGYGYVVPRSPFRTTLRYYDQHYSFGGLSYGSPYDEARGPVGGGGFGSVFGTAGSGRIGGQAPVGTLHGPWYFPGSPGNDREFLYAW
jgi:hypothetical protein